MRVEEFCEMRECHVMKNWEKTIQMSKIIIPSKGMEFRFQDFTSHSHGEEEIIHL